MAESLTITKFLFSGSEFSMYHKVTDRDSALHCLVLAPPRNVVLMEREGKNSCFVWPGDLVSKDLVPEIIRPTAIMGISRTGPQKLP